MGTGNLIKRERTKKDEAQGRTKFLSACHVLGATTLLEESD